MAEAQPDQSVRALREGPQEQVQIVLARFDPRDAQIAELDGLAGEDLRELGDRLGTDLIIDITDALEGGLGAQCGQYLGK